MSFFDEPPPLDSDIPPPLDDKLRDNDFELEDEDIIEDVRFDLPELPTDFNVFSSAATDENITYSHPPPDFQSFVISSSPPPDGFSKDVETVKNESPETYDVAKEKESFNNDEPFTPPEIESEDDKKDVDTSRCSEDDEIRVNNVNDKITIVNTAVEGNKEDLPISLQNIEKLEQEDVTKIENELDEDDDNNFNEFVTGTTETTFADALQTEDEFLGKDPEFDAFTTNFELKLEDIPDKVPELNLDDNDDDDFNDFETAIPVNRENIVFTQDETPQAAESNFEADFSAFNAFSEPKEEKTFDEFQNFKETGFASNNFEQTSTLPDDDDDDFGDFNDFTQPMEAPTVLTQQAPLELQPIALSKANVNETIEMMFPSTTSSCSSENLELTNSDFSKEHHIIKSDNFVSKFNDFDSTLALGYLYTSSKSSQSLVKALGIDTRNILLGPQWASSSAASNMPRYAANLSFSPIEPLKPSSSQVSSVKSSTDAQTSILQPAKATTEVVPEADFDWSSSGLVNPLDGSQPKPQQPNVESVFVTQPAATTTHPFENESSFNVVDQEVTQVFETEAKTNAGHKSELSETSSAYQWSSEGSSTGHLATGNVVVRERTIKLPETHIFTPVKGTSPVAREVTSREVSPIPTDDAYFSKGPIPVKEYHDVEYSLEPKKRLESDGDFDDFQSAQPAVNSNPPLVPLSLLEPKPIEKLSTEIKWPEPGNTSHSVTDDLDFLETVTSSSSVEKAPTQALTAPKLNFNLPLAPTVANTSKKKEQNFARPTIGTSPTEQNGSTESDDFNDFQAAPLQVQPIKALQSNDPITLSPARLANQHSNQQSSWISSMDNDEISRIEAAFPKCKTEKKSPQKTNEDDDDWSDFVGASQSSSSLPFPQTQPPPTISSNVMNNNSSRFMSNESDDWSDFVSVPPPIAKIPSSKSSGAISSQFPSKPNFSSWNQPIAKPYVNHTTSFLTNDSGNQQFTSSNYPYVTDKMSRHSMTITNNFNYNFNHNEIYNGKDAPPNHHQTKPNGISTILPELDFAMPKNLMSLPRSGQHDPGKK